MNEWKSLREQAGLTLAELAAKSGYSIGTINGLELHGEGSRRLKDRLRETLTEVSKIKESVTAARSASVEAGVALHDEPADYRTVTECKRRIQELERELAELRIALRVQAREINSAPPSAAADLLKRAGELHDARHPKP